MDNLIEIYTNWLKSQILSNTIIELVKVSSIAFGIILLSFLSDIVTKRIIIYYIKQYAAKSKNQWDDILVEKKVFNRLAHIVPAIVIHYFIDLLLKDMPQLVNIIHKGIYVYITVVIIMVINSFTNAMHLIYKQLPLSKDRPIKGYVQLANILVIIIGLFVIYSHITGNPIKGILAGIGALAAVLMLVFKDTILGLVASIQLTANKMVKIGDWISMPGHKADGTVIEITLNTVKVQNWDKTITTIPTYALVSESFANWRGMEESGGRRIKRSISIDMRSVKFCDNEMINKFRKISILNSYIDKKLKELEEYNSNNNINNEILVNGRRMTNLGTFRKYIEEYLRNHPKIHNDMTFLVRQLQPDEKGIPLEIYVFSNDQAWANYEGIQADIFDHILAVIPEFGLRVFQNPTGFDFEKLQH